MEHRLLNPGERRLVARRHTQRGPAGIVGRDGALVPGALLTRQRGAHKVCLPVAELVMRKRTAHGGAQATALLAHALELGSPHEHVGQDMGELLRL